MHHVKPCWRGWSLAWNLWFIFTKLDRKWTLNNWFQRNQHSPTSVLFRRPHWQRWCTNFEAYFAFRTHKEYEVVKVEVRCDHQNDHENHEIILQPQAKLVDIVPQEEAKEQSQTAFHFSDRCIRNWVFWDVWNSKIKNFITFFGSANLSKMLIKLETSQKTYWWRCCIDKN